MRKHIKLSYSGEVAVIKFDSPNAKVNSLSRELIPEFDSVFAEVSKNDNCKAIVLISGKPSGFIAGADIKMLEACKTKVNIIIYFK